MKQTIPNESIQQIFTEARTHHAWLNMPVSDEMLHKIYDLAKWGPTSLNSVPMRILFIRSAAEKEKLYPALMGSNVDQVKTAAVTAVVAMDYEFYKYLPELFPAFDARPMFTSDKIAAETTAFRNSSLQGGYFMMAVRALGLDVGPMSGFDNAKVDETFFKGTSWKSNFLCNIGTGDSSKVHPRGPRLSFEQSCKII
jgi:3-hydroxypropanoate dehydrogenase